MKRAFYISLAIIFLANCTQGNKDDCRGQILDLDNSSSTDTVNKLFNYYKTHASEFIEVKDTAGLLRYEQPNRISYFFQHSNLDSTKRKFTYKVKEGIIKTQNYQWDLILFIDNDSKTEMVCYTLKSYDNNRNNIGHVDIATWSVEDSLFTSGRIDCDSTIHMIIPPLNAHRICKINSIGENILIRTEKIKE